MRECPAGRGTILKDVRIWTLLWPWEKEQIPERDTKELS